MAEQPTEEHFVYLASKSFTAVDHHDRHTGVVPLEPFGLGVDVDFLGNQPVPKEQLVGVLAEVATLAGIKENLGGRVSHSAPPAVAFGRRRRYFRMAMGAWEALAT